MLRKSDNESYDTAIEASDWRYSASICGLIRYFRFHDMQYRIDEDTLYFNSEDIIEEKYLDYVEYSYADNMPHKNLESRLSSEEFTSDDIKDINDILKANSIMKKLFKGIKFDGENKEEILKIAQEHRYEIIKETYRNKLNLYRNYCNENLLFSEEKTSSRVVGYYIDMGKKSRSVSYNFDTSKLSLTDSRYFDFIPFAFCGNREMFFINDNSSLDMLISTNLTLESKLKKPNEEGNKQSSRSIFFNSIIESTDFIDYDVEVITKNIDNGFFETLFIRKDSIEIFNKLKDSIDYKALDSSCKINENYYISAMNEAIDAILNQYYLDRTIELFIKNKRSYVATQLIKINSLIKKGGENMNQAMNSAYMCAKDVTQKLIQKKAENKIDSYKQKLLSSVIFKDKERTCHILLQLSNYSNVYFGFANDIFEDFDGNKDALYTFINALGRNVIQNNDNGGDNNEE
ncbi:type I CRISPR-associated protein Cas8a1/Csx8 [Clostridium sp. MSJ-8]|uniref:type I CRISPR-associated protein Cas8a1/Csx8 n=1 Tax=Clostridium sp. MSJ-8 TaxID=2841510 RepID=UPI001C0EEDCD|nr:type I CRISPR-associated protein Cas8a1/Csx8 [Clostridium sp. MSJ-8]MBU5487887.1 type I CRISPR-associated protein Cas8a1/Csx8 [Clostridium sp. MSJ-8]